MGYLVWLVWSESVKFWSAAQGLPLDKKVQSQDFLLRSRRRLSAYGFVIEGVDCTVIWLLSQPQSMFCSGTQFWVGSLKEEFQSRQSDSDASRIGLCSNMFLFFEDNIC